MFRNDLVDCFLCAVQLWFEVRWNAMMINNTLQIYDEALRHPESFQGGLKWNPLKHLGNWPQTLKTWQMFKKPMNISKIHFFFEILAQIFSIFTHLHESQYAGNMSDMETGLILIAEFCNTQKVF